MAVGVGVLVGGTGVVVGVGDGVLVGGIGVAVGGGVGVGSGARAASGGGSSGVAVGVGGTGSSSQAIAAAAMPTANRHAQRMDGCLDALFAGLGMLCLGSSSLGYGITCGSRMAGIDASNRGGLASVSPVEQEDAIALDDEVDRQSASER